MSEPNKETFEKEKFISLDVSRSKWRVEMRLAKNKSVSRRVSTIEEARALRDEWLALRESMAVGGHDVPVPTVGDAPASPPPPPPAGVAEPAAAMAWASSSDDEQPALRRGTIKISRLKDAPPHKRDKFTVKFD
jgi:hypothetical protein